MQIDIPKIMNGLSELRPIFHSEADFQHALAWEVHRCFPEAAIRLEFPFKAGDGMLYLDLWLSYQKQSIAIELKYKTRDLSGTYNEENYTLKSQSAQDIGRYDFLNDVQRLEMLRNAKKYAVLLTNDRSYWNQRPSAQTVDAAFRLNEGCSIHGKLSWDSAASPGTVGITGNNRNNRGQPPIISFLTFYFLPIRQTHGG